ncbi:hypothetical protein [Candidatus Nitrosocosmicus franklandus]|uniref:Uncharacterized protein n=1 Tax=Candidatus Nitrosocosmicus franklandianus TaxID=1798806 RepID=A0A484IAW9_9ARCH|nr:hypothetical protein [Candidatus Nitrosocosmicus franklandus]VFJ13165.1 protein of unknown function [Candidatus Nitrosocosmicus franklandus]
MWKGSSDVAIVLLTNDQVDVATKNDILIWLQMSVDLSSHLNRRVGPSFLGLLKKYGSCIVGDVDDVGKRYKPLTKLLEM